MKKEFDKKELSEKRNTDLQEFEVDHQNIEQISDGEDVGVNIPAELITANTFGKHLNNLIKKGGETLLNMDAGNTVMPIRISDKEFGFDIWLFAEGKEGYYLKSLYRDGILRKLVSMGYYKRAHENNTYYFIQEDNNIIKEAEPYNMKDDVWDFVKSLDSTLEIDFEGQIISETAEKLRETFLRQSHLVFNKIFLEQLPIHIKPILRDTKQAAFFYFNNHIIKVTVNGWEILEYSNVVGYCIWHSQMIKRDFEYFKKYEDCHFAKFIQNVCNYDLHRHAALISGIGYLLHNHVTPNKAQAVIAYDEEITDLFNPMGGTGKGLLGNALKQVRNVTSIDGKKFKADDKFKFQRITESTQIVWLDDPKPGFPFEIFNSVLTEGWDIEKKYEKETHIPAEISPKIFITSNSVLVGGGSTAKRRQHLTEFSNHYSKQIKYGNEEPIMVEHGGLFFDKVDWNSNEWNKFYSLMLDSVCYYLQKGLVYCEPKGVQRNNLIQSTNDEFAAWVGDKNFQPGVKYYSKEIYEDFKKNYPFYGDVKQRNLTEWLKKYASVNDWKYQTAHSGDVITFSFVTQGN